MVGKLSRLPVETQQALAAARLSGQQRGGRPPGHGLRDMRRRQLHAICRKRCALELVLHADGAYTFLHDRVQEAAYSLIPEDSRAEAHLRIGRLLAAHTPPEKREEAIFEIVNQLNRGVALDHIAATSASNWRSST